MANNEFTYAIAISTILLASFYIGSKFINQHHHHHHGKHIDNTDDYDSIKQYLLNDTSLLGAHKPKIWIHSKFEYNARKWKSFQSRSSMELNQPYIHLTIKSIIDHCGKDFHVCLIDDKTFSKLLPEWDIKLEQIADPLKSRYRQIGMVELVHRYGGMILPNSIVCRKSLKDMYYAGIESGRPFVCEAVNRTMNLAKMKHTSAFIPSTYIFGAEAHNTVVGELIQYLKHINNIAHFSSEHEFLGDIGQWCLDRIRGSDMNIVGGEIVGIKTSRGRPISVDQLMGEAYLDLSAACIAIYIPEDEILNRTKYEWFAVVGENELLETTPVIVKYLKAALVDATDEYSLNVSHEVSSISSI